MSAAVQQPDARPEPILVCGVGRSGTSLLQAMLAAIGVEDAAKYRWPPTR